MTRLAPISVSANNVSTAWLETLQAVRALPGGHAFHSITRIAEPQAEDPRIRQAIDDLLTEPGKSSVGTVANTILPERMAASSPTPEALVARYRAVLPTLRRLHHDNRRGTYFGRLVSYEAPDGPVDQLSGAIAKLRAEHYNRAPKTARYEIGFDEPAEDETTDHQMEASEVLQVYKPGRDNAIMGFPCLSFCSFQLDGDQLHLVAQYRSQRLVQRGYGNYLGLGQLQAYVAHEAGLVPGELLVLAGRVEADITQRRLSALLDSLR